MMSSHTIKYRLMLIVLLLLSSALYAADEINSQAIYALQGYDPVTYFDGKPVQGESDIYVDHQKIKYLFLSVSNKKKFLAEPELYIPMYGGYCAYGVRLGKKLNIDPQAYEVKDGHLYVLLNRATHKIWAQDMDRNIKISDRLWPTIKNRTVKSLLE